MLSDILTHKSWRPGLWTPTSVDLEATEGRRQSQLHQHTPSALDKHTSIVLAPPLQGQLETLGVKSATTAEVLGISMPQLQAEEPLL